MTTVYPYQDSIYCLAYAQLDVAAGAQAGSGSGQLAAPGGT